METSNVTARGVPFGNAVPSNSRAADAMGGKQRFLSSSDKNIKNGNLLNASTLRDLLKGIADARFSSCNKWRLMDNETNH